MNRACTALVCFAWLLLAGLLGCNATDVGNPKAIQLEYVFVREAVSGLEVYGLPSAAEPSVEVEVVAQPGDVRFVSVSELDGSFVVPIAAGPWTSFVVRAVNGSKASDPISVSPSRTEPPREVPVEPSTDPADAGSPDASSESEPQPDASTAPDDSTAKASDAGAPEVLTCDALTAEAERRMALVLASATVGCGTGADCEAIDPSTSCAAACEVLVLRSSLPAITEAAADIERTVCAQFITAGCSISVERCDANPQSIPTSSGPTVIGADRIMLRNPSGGRTSEE